MSADAGSLGALGWRRGKRKLQRALGPETKLFRGIFAFIFRTPAVTKLHGVGFFCGVLLRAIPPLFVIPNSPLSRKNVFLSRRPTSDVSECATGDKLHHIFRSRVASDPFCCFVLCNFMIVLCAKSGNPRAGSNKFGI